MKKKLGRPKLPDSEKAKYQRTALYPDTHQKAKQMADKDGVYLIDLLRDLVDKEYKARNPHKVLTFLNR